MNGADLAGRPVIVGGGVAGLATALHLAPEPVVLMSKAPIGTEASSPWAQGGLAAAVGGDDRLELHVTDTLDAADGLADPAMAERILAAAPAAIETLSRWGVRFDQDATGALSLGLEAAHSCRRIVHAGGDATGRELVRALCDQVRRTPSITVLEGAEVRRLMVEDGRIVGVLAVNGRGVMALPAGRVVLATGGLGGLFDATTNPAGSIGQGLALAARAGAVLADMEFVQFHPTALATGSRPLPLVSEAVRGEGAILVDEHGRRLLQQVPGRELAPRDVVARALFAGLAQGRRVFLDARTLGPAFAARFPAIDAACKAAGIDPAVDPIPVTPAAHYHMGGVAVDLNGRSTVEGLWACGEVAATGLHGANRLASNSLTEAIVGARLVAGSVASAPAAAHPLRPLNEVPPAADAASIRPLVSAHLGVIRDEAGLLSALSELLPLTVSGRDAADPAIVALMMAVAALLRRESRGGHFRSDCPQPKPLPAGGTARRSSLTLAEATGLAYRHVHGQRRPAWM